MIFKRNRPNAAARRDPVVERETPVPVIKRPATVARRSYQAAQSDRIAGGFSLFPTTTRAELRRDVRGLMGHARHASQNFDFARSYEMLFRRHVIGPDGIRLKMDIRDPGGARDETANGIIETEWKRWCKSGNPTPCGRWSWWAIECQIATAIAREGGALVRLHTGRRRGVHAFQVEPIPLDLLDLDLTQSLSGGGWIESGIECNADGRPMAFHIWAAPLDAPHLGVTRQRLRVPAASMVWVTVPEEVAQLLGIPRSATALRMMNLSEKFQKSAMTAANYGAAAMLFLEHEDAQMGATAAPTDQEDIEPFEIEAGTQVDLPPGVKANYAKPNYPDAAVEPFLRTMGTSTAAGMGVSYETLTSDLKGANFSSLRAGKGEERDEWRMLQRAIYEGLHDRVFSEWLAMAMLSGALSPLPVTKLDKFDAATWQPRGWPSVNPKEDATANETEIRNGTKSRTEIAASRGRDIRDIRAELDAEEAMGFTVSLQPGAQPVPPLGTSSDTPAED